MPPLVYTAVRSRYWSRPRSWSSLAGQTRSLLSTLLARFWAMRDMQCSLVDWRITNIFWEMASQFPENTSMASNFMPQESYCRKQVQMDFAVLGFLARCIRSFWSMQGLELWEMSISFFGKPWIRSQFGSLFPEYDSWGPGLDATEVFPGNHEAVSRKMQNTPVLHQL